MIKNRFWYFPYNPRVYDAIRAFKEQGFILWQTKGRQYQVGDILYIYSSRPIQQVVYKAEVTEINIIYHSWMDNDKDYYINPPADDEEGKVMMRVEPIMKNGNKDINYEFLQKIGIKGFMSSHAISSDQVTKIEAFWK